MLLCFQYLYGKIRCTVGNSREQHTSNDGAVVICARDALTAEITKVEAKYVSYQGDSNVSLIQAIETVTKA